MVISDLGKSKVDKGDMEYQAKIKVESLNNGQGRKVSVRM